MAKDGLLIYIESRLGGDWPRLTAVQTLATGRHCATVGSAERYCLAILDVETSMTVTKPSELEGLKAIGAIVAATLQRMGHMIEPGMTTRELDEIGRRALEREGAKPAPELVYGFPGATCISVNHVIAHGIPGKQVIGPGDLVNIDVSAEKKRFLR